MAGRSAGGAKFNLQGGDMIGFNFCYAEGAAGCCTNQASYALYNNSDSVGVGWIADGVFGTGTEIELTRVWSALAAYEHIWNPKWRTAIGGGYVNVDYNGAATNLIIQRFPVRVANCGVRGGRGDPSLLSRRCSATAAVRTTASGKPIPAPSGTRCRSSISV